MEKRRLGNSDLEAAPLAFGGNVFGWTADEPTSFRLLDAFTDAGFNLIDTANSYSSWVPGNKGGESETIIGNWLKKTGKRAQVILATKVGSEMGKGHGLLTREHIFEQVEDSLQRLQTDYIDLYQSHFDDGKTPVGETIEAYAELIRQGKVRAIGASNLSPERLNDSLQYSREHGLPRYETLQPEYNLYDRVGYETNYEAICLREGLGVLNYFALARGFLSGKYRRPEDASKSPRGESVVSSYFNERGFRVLRALDDVAARRGSSLTAVSLAWLVARPGITAPIASATSTEQLEELMKGVQLRLHVEDILQLDAASAVE